MINTHSYIKAAMDNLFKAEYRRLDKSITKIHEANQERKRLRLDGFMYMGVFYKPEATPLGPGQRLTLHLDLWPQMDEHLADVKTVEYDRKCIHQLLFKVLEPCGYIGGNVFQNMRDVIPDCILDTFAEEIRSLHRIGSPTATIHHVRDLRQLSALIPKMEFYSASRMLY